MIRSQQETIVFGNKTTCGGIDIPLAFQQKEYNQDLVIFVSFQYDNSNNYYAYSGPCKITKYDLRPIFGVINWNLRQLQMKNVNSFAIQQNIQTSIHEIIHALGFIKILYQYYYDPQTLQFYNLTSEKDQNNHLILSTPRLANTSKEYFQCDLITGAVMENQGGDNSADHHFERTYYFNELMTGSQMNGQSVLSEFTFALLSDFGQYYRLLKYKRDFMTYGRAKGCDFLFKSCKELEVDEFCQENEYTCSFGNIGIGKCGQDQLSDQCSYRSIFKGMDCKNPFQFQTQEQIDHFSQTKSTVSENSLCFQISYKEEKVETLSERLSQIKESCYRIKCKNDQIHIIFQQNDNDYIQVHCPENETITFSEINFQIKCPQNSKQICANQNDCQNQCNSRGFCVNQQCTCQFGFSGYYCENECNGFRKEDKCLIECDEQDYADSNSMYCLTCSGNCKTCKSIIECLECEDGYHLVDNFCEPLYQKIQSSSIQFYSTTQKIILILLIILI
ncbi:unnamed protein product (macronuclear) [Paramecium tetraurelia]|uniref:EGF-like domain-containing protein n=1 Tax=Paramecium tetraurelia TaxID=5888 RepID=A0D705_PARTE|nr:uncharacterized protein GSPATT00001863001 [Paramecium tetraurelia]CAK78822.1 unnamed protein product [Paramecium tetraurelia]|eukprot:XP_001446219.1 hypothetical protein (macronuclear) [Paramecium tetraurelia strain d4-2]